MTGFVSFMNKICKTRESLASLKGNAISGKCFSKRNKEEQIVFFDPWTKVTFKFYPLGKGTCLSKNIRKCKVESTEK